LPSCVDGSFGGLSEQKLELGKDLLDRVEVWAVGRQEQQFSPCRPDGLAHGLALVAAEVVHDHDVAGQERGHEELLDIGGEELAVDRPVEHTWCVDAVMAKRGKEGQRFPLAEGGFGQQLVSAPGPAPDRGHVGLGPGFIDEDEPLGIKPSLILLPLLAPSGDLGPILFGGEQRFF